MVHRAVRAGAPAVLDEGGMLAASDLHGSSAALSLIALLPGGSPAVFLHHFSTCKAQVARTGRHRPTGVPLAILA